MTTEFAPGRLMLARRRRGLTKVALAKLVDLTSRRIAAFENEGEQPSAEALVRLAAATRFPVDFFHREAPPELSADGVSFRSFTKMTARQRDSAIAAGALAVELSEWIDHHFELPPTDIPDLRDVDAGTAAVALRQMWGLGHKPAPNMVHLLEQHGVRVFSLMDDCAEVDAFSMWASDRPHVLLSLKKSAERGRWDAAHELGHLVLHVGFPPAGRSQENDADSFAGELLMPAHGIRATAPRRVTLAAVKTEKVRWKVSALAYIRRLHQLELITEWQYRQLVIEASQAGYRRTEGDIERERSKVSAKVLDLLAEEGQNLTAVAAELAIPIDDLRQLLFDLPLRGVAGTGDGSERRRGHLRLAHSAD